MTTGMGGGFELSPPVTRGTCGVGAYQTQPHGKTHL